MIQSSVVVFGEALVDLFKDGLVVGGAPFNVARHLAGFGLHPLFISAIGEDNAGDLISQEIKRYQLAPQGVQILPNVHTGTVQVHENAQGHQFEIMPNCAYDAIEATAAVACVSVFNKVDTKASTHARILYHGTLGLRGSVSYNTFQAVCTQVKTVPNANIFLDINWRAGHVEQAVAVQCLKDADIVKLSIEELQMVLVWFKVQVSCESNLPASGATEHPIQRLMAQMKAHLLLVTYGELGSAAFNREGICISCAPALSGTVVVDTVGAGDAFSSVMLLALTQHWPIEAALKRANAFAAAVCGIRGATPNNLAFYQEYALAWKI
jgi:fructokinase